MNKIHKTVLFFKRWLPLVCSLSPLSGPLAGAAAPLVGIDGWQHIEHIKRALGISEYPLFIFATHKQIYFLKTGIERYF